MFSAPIKGRSPCYASLHSEEYGHITTWNIHNAGKHYIMGSKLLLQLENKQQIMQNNVETQHNRMYSLYIGSLCNVAFPMARFTCIVTSQVFVEIWMRWSIALSAAFYTGRKHLWIVFSFKNMIPELSFLSWYERHLSIKAIVHEFYSSLSNVTLCISWVIIWRSISVKVTTILAQWNISLWWIKKLALWWG